MVKFYIGMTNDTDSPDQVAYEVLIDSVVWCADKVSDHCNTHFKTFFAAVQLMFFMIAAVFFFSSISLLS